MKIDPNETDKFVENNFFSQDIPFEERKYVFNKLFFHYKKDWQSSFALMLFLSVGIASLGLSENSTATIIGAMIIAPLGQPIVALGGAIALGWRIQSFRMVGIIIIGTICSIIVSYLIGLTLPDLTPNEQILIRTAPDLRDLGIALFAGAAGSYGYYRSEYSTVLAGVGIAVALVTPICACGLMLEQGHYILAGGSILMFVTNLLAVAFSAILVFFLLGLKHKRNRKWFYKGSIIVVLLGAATILPLALNYDKFSSSAKFQTAIYEQAGTVFVQSKNAPVIKKITVQGTAAFITIEPYPNSIIEKDRMIRELERTTGLQIFLLNNFDTDYLDN
ncbi:DUF389 domain-containing protein [Flavobacterium ardleyense]|uniref:DUF389 domain-containing protein n=1 Tax=Flavobacterium ardleyense TaxID=2038737 RepID=A0ABW5Z8X0_9FLAO